jgi:alpha-beta hydrolase superfamily lysophospholipase
MDAAARRLGRRHQVYALDYPDFRVDPSLNGRALAARLAELRASYGDGRPLLIVTHSLGGFVARAALNEMTASGELARWGRVRAVCVDAPWHGIPSGPFPLPGSLDELRARSPLLEDGFLMRRVADNASIELVFASEGVAALDYTQGVLRDLPEKLARYYAAGEPVSGSPRLMNFWHALLWSAQYPPFRGELSARAAAGTLDAAAVSSALAEHFPRFPGGHTGVLASPELLDFLDR